MNHKPQVRMKLEQIARLRVAGRKNTQIAVEMGMSYAGLSQILALDAYKEIEQEVQENLLGVMDATLQQSRVELIRQQKVEALREQIRDYIPDALQNVLDQVRLKKDLRASLELLDRDPDCAAIKRNKLPQGNGVGANNSPTVDSTAVEAIRGEAKKTTDMLIRVPMAQTANA